MNPRLQQSRLKSLPHETAAVAIDALHLDLCGIPAATAQAAVQLLGPALADALSHPRHISLSHTSSAADVAAAIAQQLARHLGGQTP